MSKNTKILATTIMMIVGIILIMLSGYSIFVLLLGLALIILAMLTRRKEDTGAFGAVIMIFSGIFIITSKDSSLITFGWGLIIIGILYGFKFH
jgi:uncharacterized membrane protein YhaH (DUF805 family)